MPINNDELERLGYAIVPQETRGIYGFGPWHPRVYHAIQYARRMDTIGPQEHRLSYNVDVITRNASERLDDIERETAAMLDALEQQIDALFLDAAWRVRCIATEARVGGVRHAPV